MNSTVYIQHAGKTSGAEASRIVGSTSQLKYIAKQVIPDTEKIKLWKEISCKATKLSEYEKDKRSCIGRYQRSVILGFGHYLCKL